MDVDTLNRGLVAIFGVGAHNVPHRIKQATVEIALELAPYELGQRGRGEAVLYCGVERLQIFPHQLSTHRRRTSSRRSLRPVAMPEHRWPRCHLTSRVSRAGLTPRPSEPSTRRSRAPVPGQWEAVRFPPQPEFSAPADSDAGVPGSDGGAGNPAARPEDRGSNADRRANDVQHGQRPFSYRDQVQTHSGRTGSSVDLLAGVAGVGIKDGHECQAWTRVAYSA